MSKKEKRTEGYPHLFLFMLEWIRKGGYVMKKTKKEKKRLFFISIAIIGLIICLVTSVSNDWGKILENNRKINELTSEYEKLLNDEEKLKSEVTKLQDDEYVARYAKEKFLYSSAGETIIRMD